MSAARAHDPPDADRPNGPPEGPPGDEVVAVLRWPAEADVRHALSAAGHPRLLVVDADAPPPLVWDDREDWTRDGAGPVEIATRTTRLARAVASGRPPRPPLPVLDADGVLHGADGALAIVPPIEAAMLARLLDRPGHVVHREDLHRAGWPTDGRDPRAVDGRVRNLRRRLVGMGVAIHTVRGVGYLLEVERG
jgi:hypothetical protein